MQRPLIDRKKAGILLIDAQPAFFETMAGPIEPVLARLEQLLLYSSAFRLPLIATFEHPVEEKGLLPDRLERFFPSHGVKCTKRIFNCCDDPAVRETLEKLSVRQLAVAGAETDVCILQSVLGLLKMKFQVFLLEDCLFTSEAHPRAALDRMVSAGAVACTLKTFYYELTRSVDFAFPRGGKERPDGAPGAKLIPPEKLPPRQP